MMIIPITATDIAASSEEGAGGDAKLPLLAKEEQYDGISGATRGTAEESSRTRWSVSSSFILRSMQLFIGCAFTIIVAAEANACMKRPSEWIECSRISGDDSCRAKCYLDEHHLYNEIHTNITDSSTGAVTQYTTYNTPNAYWNLTVENESGLPSSSRCMAGMKSNCYCGAVDLPYLVPLVYFLQIVILATYQCLRPKNVELMLAKAKYAYSYTLGAEGVVLLLHPVNCLYLACQVAVVGLVLTFWYPNVSSFVTCSFHDYSPGHTILDTLLMISFLVTLEVISPNLLMFIEYYRTEGMTRRALIALIRIDATALYILMSFLQLAAMPLSLLTYVSLVRQRTGRLKETNLSLDMRQSTISSPVVANDHESDLKTVPSSPCSVLLKIFSSRFTVVYSFGKLFAAIVVSIVTSQGYNFCHDQHDAIGSNYCPTNCQVTCLTETFTHCYDDEYTGQFNYDYCPSNTFPCAQAVNGCLCMNWVLVDFLVICMNLIHFMCQCIYLVLYDNFDPQQNQIECVQSYSFVGDNLTLFLTHPVFCFLSALEFSILIDSWIGVFLGVRCPGSEASARSIYFAASMTALEVYKANTSMCWKNFKNGEYIWAIWSLLRVDLFVFFGFTLLMQCFIFPISIMGYLVVGVRNWLWPRESEEYMGVKAECEQNEYFPDDAANNRIAQGPQQTRGSAVINIDESVTLLTTNNYEQLGDVTSSIYNAETTAYEPTNQVNLEKLW
jgi:hypothetical protein